MTAHYWGDNGAKTLYGIKNQGTASACYMKWEYLTTGAGKSYLRISRWPADAAATFTDKDLNTVKGEFAAMPAATRSVRTTWCGLYYRQQRNLQQSAYRGFLLVFIAGW